MAFSTPVLTNSSATMEEIVVSTDTYVLTVKNQLGSIGRALEVILLSDAVNGTPVPLAVPLYDQVFSVVGALATSSTTARLYWNDAAADASVYPIRQVDVDLASRTVGAVTLLPFGGRDPYPVDARTIGEPNRIYLVYATPTGGNAYRVSADFGATFGPEVIVDPNGSGITSVEANINDPQGLKEDVQVLQRRL